MPSVQQIKSRLKSVSATKQITGALQLVSASKMRRAMVDVRRTLPYVTATRRLLADLARDASILEINGLFKRRTLTRRLLIVISSDSGLAGAYNSKIAHELSEQLQTDVARHVTTAVVTVGRKISEFANKLRGVTVLASFVPSPEADDVAINSLLKLVVDEFRSEHYDAVDVIYTKFHSSLNQAATAEHLLPIGRTNDDTTVDQQLDAKFEPSRSAVLTAVLERLLRAEIVQALLDSRASEHSMRMMAMKNATDNASDLTDDLTLAMNKERQAHITQEISEISAGAEAVV